MDIIRIVRAIRCGSLGAAGNMVCAACDMVLLFLNMNSEVSLSIARTITRGWLYLICPYLVEYVWYN